MKENVKEAQKSDVFTKENILKSKRYYNRQDLLNALLDDGTCYTFEQVDNIIGEFMKGAK